MVFSDLASELYTESILLGTYQWKRGQFPLLPVQKAETSPLGQGKDTQYS